MQVLLATLLLGTVSARTDSLIEPRQLVGAFSGTAAQIDNYDPHDYVPPAYGKIRVAHAALMSTAWLVIFPIGAILPRILGETHVAWVRVHVVCQMIGFWIVMAAAGMGIWMAKQLGQLHAYHPSFGLALVGVLILQPLTEILNHRFYASHPKIIKLAYLHIWLGRAMLVLGAIQGGLGFLYASSFKKTDTDLAPRIAYGGTVVFVFLFYVCVGVIYPEFRGSVSRKIQKVRNTSLAAQATGDVRSVRANSVAPSIQTYVSMPAPPYPVPIPQGFGRINSRGPSIRSNAATAASLAPTYASYVPTRPSRSPLPDSLNPMYSNSSFPSPALIHAPSFASAESPKIYGSGMSPRT